jgi:ESF2/ABP1 family protein
MKYLKGFKWNHLTEQVANENAERAARTREEIRRTRKENKAFVEDVERAKMLEGMEGKRRAKAQRGDGDGAGGKEIRRRQLEFTQRKAKGRGGEGGGADSSKVLGMIF